MDPLTEVQAARDSLAAADKHLAQAIQLLTPPVPPPVVSAFGLRPGDDTLCPFNQPIPAGSKHPQSDTWMANLRTLTKACWVNTNGWTDACWWVVAGQGGWAYDTVYLTFGGPTREYSLTMPVNKSLLWSDQTSDGSFTVVDTTGSPDGSDTSKWWVYNGAKPVLQPDGHYNVVTAVRYPFKSSLCWQVPGRDGSTIATGRGSQTAYLAGTILPDELANGFHHALAVSLPNGATRGPADVYNAAICAEPAQRSDGSRGTNSAWPPYGFRAQLDPAFNVEAYTLNVPLRNLLKAWQTYGVLHGDSTGTNTNWTFSAAHTLGQSGFGNPAHPSYTGLQLGFGAGILDHVWIVNSPTGLQYEDRTTVGGPATV